MPSPPLAGSDLQPIREEPTGQAASGKQSSPVQAVPSMIHDVPQHVVDARSRAGTVSTCSFLEAFWLDVTSVIVSPAILKPGAIFLFSEPRREG
jgi:hypothetical protein